MKTRICLFLILTALVLSACTPAVAASPESGKTPNAEVEPPAVFTDPETGQTVTVKCSRSSDEVRLLINSVHGYCLQYPAEYDVFHPNDSEIMLFKRSVLNANKPSVSIKVQPSGELTLERAADQIAQVYSVPGTEPIRETLTMDGETAIMLGGLSGQDPNRQVVVQHDNQLYYLFFIEFNKSYPEYAHFETLYNTVIQTFNFSPNSNACPGCPAPEAPLPTVTPPTVMTDDGCSPAETLTGENGRIAYWGISFHLDAALGTSVMAQQCAAVPFRLEDAPGTAHPAGVTFTFPTDRQRVDFQPLIVVYAIEGDMQDYLYPLNSLGDLQNLLKLRPVPSPWSDAAPLHVRPQYLDFAGGAGVRGVIQYMQDVFFYTNNGLLYNFDGLTSDGRYYVNVRIPLAVPFLMDIEHSDPLTNINPDAIPISGWPNDYALQGPIVEAYNQEALHRFDQATDADFTPDLAVLDALVRSLEITAP